MLEAGKKIQKNNIVERKRKIEEPHTHKHTYIHTHSTKIKKLTRKPIREYVIFYLLCFSLTHQYTELLIINALELVVYITETGSS